VRLNTVLCNNSRGKEMLQFVSYKGNLTMAGDRVTHYWHTK